MIKYKYELEVGGFELFSAMLCAANLPTRSKLRLQQHSARVFKHQVHHTTQVQV
jgi:hypothetical protein